MTLVIIQVHEKLEISTKVRTGHALCHLASRLANMVREGGRQTKNLVLAIF